MIFEKCDPECEKAHLEIQCPKVPVKYNLSYFGNYMLPLKINSKYKSKKDLNCEIRDYLPLRSICPIKYQMATLFKEKKDKTDYR